MILEIQIKSLVFSFLFGIYFSYMIRINYKYILSLNKLFKILGTLILVFSNMLLYFVILLKINYGLIHIYLILMIILGVYIEYIINKLIVKIKKKWYTHFRVGGNVKKNRMTKSSKKRLIVFGTLSFFIIIYFMVNIVLYIYNIGSLNIKKDNLNNNLIELKREEKILTNEIEKLQDPAYIAKYAREHYSYSKDGEYIIKINDKEKVTKEQKFELNINYKYVIFGSLLFLLLIIGILKKKKWFILFF